MVSPIFIIFILFFVCASVYCYNIKYKSTYLAFLLLFGVAFGIIIVNIIKNKCDNNNSITSNQQCIIGNNKLYNGLFHGGCVDVFHVLHILLWLLVGQLMPNQYLLIAVLSVLWETFEHFGFQYLCKTKNIFQGRIEDVFLNMVGYYIGSKLAYCR